MGGRNHNKYYTFNCLDAAFNTKARIRVLVRDWDNEFSPESSSVESFTGGAWDGTSAQDDIYDLDAIFSIGTISAPDYTACTGTVSTDAVVTVGFDLSLVAGDPTATLNTNSTFRLSKGTVIEISSTTVTGAGANLYYALAEDLNVGDRTIKLATIPTFSDNNVSFSVVRMVPFTLKNTL
jgi:hypothetical protein